jgi:uncharacterized protein YciI
MHYLMMYEFVPDYLERRGDFRSEHLKLAWEASMRGELLAAGAFDPAEGAALFFQGSSPEVAERFARADPYVRNGLVTSWTVRKWTTVVGAIADTPIREL